MTLATSCPACGTVFKIVEDQLKVSEGWVRCGHCQDVFNALEGLFDLAGRERPPLNGSAPPPAARTIAATASHGLPRGGARAASGVSTRSPLAPEPDAGQAQSSDRPDSRRGSVWDLAAARQHEQNRQAAWQARPPGTADAPADVGDGTVHFQRRAADPTPKVPIDSFLGSEHDGRVGASAAPSRHRFPAVKDDTVDAVDLSEADTVFLAHDPSASFDDPFDSMASVRTPVPEDDEASSRWRQRDEAGLPDPVSAAALAASLAETTSAAEPMPPLPTFVRQADRAARWRQPGMRTALGLGCLIAASALAAQVLVHHRDGASARWPTLRPPLEALCAPLDCVVQAPHQLDALVVESTALTRPAGVDGYRLQLLLRNHAEFAVLAPHVELSLTDAAGAVVVRRVIAPTDFRQPDTLGGNSEGNWQLELTSTDKRVAGYTVAVFYP